MNLKNMLNERSQTEEVTYIMMITSVYPKSVNPYRQKAEQMLLAVGEGCTGNNYLLPGSESG